MAKKQAIATSSAVSNSPIPAGFTAVKGGEFAPIHDFIKNKVAQGVVSDKKIVKVKRGKSLVDVNVITISDKNTGEQTSIWESSALEGLMAEVKSGDEVFVRFNGVKALKGRKSLKMFTCAIKSKSGSNK